METVVEKKRGRHRRWVWRGVIVVAVLVVGIGAIPFLFTTAVVRWGLARSAYGRFSPEVSGASLSLGGELVLRDLALHELAPHADRVLLKVGRLRVRFAWGGVMDGTLQDVDAEDVVVFGREGDSGGELTVMEVVGSGDQPSAGKSTAAAKPIWMDHLDCGGTLRMEGLDGVGVPDGSYPFHVTMKMRGDRRKPTQEVAASIGASAESGRISGQIVVEPTAAGDRITIEALSARELHETLAESVAKGMLKQLPKAFQQELAGRVATLDGSGVIERTGSGMTIAGHLDVSGIDVASKVDSARPFELKGLAFGGDVEGPLSAEFLKSGTAKNGTMGMELLSYGKNRVERFAAPWGMENGVLESAGVTLMFAKADLEGAVRFSLAERRLVTAKFSVKHLDQAEVAHNIAPDRFDAEGTVSGEIELGSDEKGTIVGRILLTSDGPGRLRIKDQATAAALAQKLEVGANTGVLPPNFSTMVVGQLEDYPYKTGRIEVSAPDGLPVVTLNYQREGVKAGEPGYGVKTKIGGQEVVANYTVQLPGVTIVLKGKTVQEILSLAAGLGEEIAGGPAAK